MRKAAIILFFLLFCIGLSAIGAERSVLLVDFSSGQWLEFPITNRLNITPTYRTVCIDDGSHKAYLYIDEIESLGFAISQTQSSLQEVLAKQDENCPWRICLANGTEIASGKGRPQLSELEAGQMYIVSVGSVTFKYTPTR